MLKRVLIISPHFPPVNAPDMHRIRMSLPYYKALGWEPVVLCVDERFVNGFRDDLLNDTIPEDIEVHKVTAWKESTSRKVGIGNLSMRSYSQIKKKGSELLKSKKFDLVFFSTSLFQVCVLGRYWKKKFGVKFIIDMQDPWRNDFYLQQPSQHRPRKFALSHLMDRVLEKYTMPHASGIMSVSQAYIDILKNRYKELQNKPCLLLPFGVATEDFNLVLRKKIEPGIIHETKDKINVVYVGVLNQFFMPLIEAFFIAFSKSVTRPDDYRFYFIGTNYAVGITHLPVEELARKHGIEHLVTEVPERITYFSALATLLHSDIIFIPGSTDATYNASKLYNNIYANKPIFSIFNEKSLVIKAIEDLNAGIAVGINEEDSLDDMVDKICKVMPSFQQLRHKSSGFNSIELEKFYEPSMAAQQVELFNATSGVQVAKEHMSLRAYFVISFLRLIDSVF
jgi:glycosyltransferase involved in cell wall biosynthesis